MFYFTFLDPEQNSSSESELSTYLQECYTMNCTTSTAHLNPSVALSLMKNQFGSVYFTKVLFYNIKVNKYKLR